jgi:hypothetical protein
MTKVTIIPKTRIRLSPTDPDLSNVLASTEQLPVPVEAEREGDWYKIVTYVMADRVSESRPMPWYSQLGVGRRNACGPACVAMMLDLLTGRRQDVAALSRASDPPQDGTTSTDLERLAAANGARLHTIAGRAFQPITVLPAIVLVKYLFDRADTYWDDFYGLHWLILLAYDNDKVVCHDPLFPSANAAGAFVRYRMSEWLNASNISGTTYSLAAGDDKRSRVSRFLSWPAISPRSQSPGDEIIEMVEARKALAKQEQA